MSWIFILIIFLFFYFLAIGKLEKLLAPSKWKWWIVSPIYLISMMLLAILTRVFLFEICVVPSSSMNDTIYFGDHVLINKLTYGPQLPRHIAEVPWLHVAYYFVTGSEKYHNTKEQIRTIDQHRLSGYTTIKRQDIVIFESNTANENLYIKRCVGIPGDTIAIQRGVLKINNKIVEAPKYYVMDYLITYNTSTKFLDEANLRYRLSYSKGNSIKVRLNREELKRVKLVNGFLNADFDLILPNISEQRIWPPNKSTVWSSDVYGPIVIPGSHFSLTIDSSDYIPNEFINLQDPTIIEENYYFVIGDNRHNSHDSRTWGLVPESSIKGKGSLVLFNSQRKQFWNRFLKL